MRKLFFAVFAITLNFPLVAGAGEIRIAGAGSALGTMKLIANAYNQSHPHTKVLVYESIGSSGAIRAIADGSIEIGLSSRTLTDEEAQLGLRATEYARSPTVFAVRTQNKVTAITINEIVAIYNGKLRHWPDGTLIRPVLRQPGEDNAKLILKLSPEMAASLDLAKDRPGTPFAVTDQDTADKMESIPGSIGVATLGLILSEKRTLRALILDGVKPTPENADSGRYPLVKRLYLVLPNSPSNETISFVNFLNSTNGRAILKRTGHTIP